MAATTKIKVYELAKELGQDGQSLVEVVQRLGINVKNTMSSLGSEEVRTVREYYRQQRSLTKSPNSAAAGVARAGVTEKRVGATVIRRRKKPGEEDSKPELVHDGPLEAASEEFEQSAPEMEDNTAVAVQSESELAQVETVEADEQDVEAPTVEAELEAAPETVELPVEAPAPAVQKAVSKAPAGPATVAAVPAVKPKPPEIKRRLFPSIIKKVSTESYLGEKVGPKVERKARPVAPAPGTRPAVAAGASTETGPFGLKRVKEVELTAAVDAAKEVGRRRQAQRQDSVFRSTDYLKRELIHATKKRKNIISRPALKTQLTKAADHKRIVQMDGTITVAELAKAMSVKAGPVISKLMNLGVTATMNESVDFDTATLIAQEMGFEVRNNAFKEEDYLPQIAVDESAMKPRPPVVTIMGHVDHGKTSLLDYIRKAKVAEGEAGGITQHVGAYMVETPNGNITFVDTPGHEAFTAMRARGAKVTDLVIIVVSAVDGVMPQTQESVNHAKAAGVPIIVAVNKTDLPDANPDKTRQQMAALDLAPEEWGGDTIYVNVSAKTGKGIDTLLESVLLQSEMLQLKANYDVPAKGSVIESRLEKATGPIATVLVQQGTLKQGDIVVCGTSVGKVRAMTSTLGKKMTEAVPGMPVELLGLGEVPVVGDELQAVESERAARELCDARVDKQRAKAGISRKKMTLEEILQGGSDGEKELRVILKADVQGSTEALREALSKFPEDRVKLKVLHSATGGITESDVMLAAASKAVILGFNVRPDVKALKLSEREGLQLKTYSIIYDLVEDAKQMLEGLLDSDVKEKVIGRAEVRETFSVPKIGTIAGSSVIDGKVIRGCFLRLLRDSRVIYEGRISSLRRFKDDVKEVTSGYECGIGLENFTDIRPGDQFEAFLKEERRGTL
jgi:translation initiation factor IF-2